MKYPSGFSAFRSFLLRHGDGSIVLIDFIMKPCDGEHLEDNAGSRLTDQEAIKEVCEISSCKMYRKSVDGIIDAEKMTGISKDVI